jgi:hypothetical protein
MIYYPCEIDVKKFSSVSSWVREVKFRLGHLMLSNVRLYFFKESSLNVFEKAGQMVIAGRGTSFIL